MTSLKNELFDSDKLKDNHLLPLNEFNAILTKTTHGRLDNIAPKIVNELKNPDGYINL